MASIQTFEDKNRKRRYKVSWELSRKDGQRHRQSKTFPPGTKKSTVEEFKRQKELELIMGDTFVNSEITLSKFVEDVYFPTYCAQLSQSTVVNYRRLYDSSKDYCIKKRFGSYKMKDIKRRMVQDYANFLSTVVTPKTVSEYIHWLHTVYDTAIKEEIIKPSCNPTEMLKLPRREKPKIEAFTLEQYNLLLASTADDRCNRLVIGLGGLAGLRRAEIMGLRWKDIDLDVPEPVMRIVNTRIYTGGKIYEKAPKSQAGMRVIPLPQTLVRILKDERKFYLENKLKYGANFNDSGYVVVKEDGTPRRPGSVADHYTCYVKRMEKVHGIPYMSLHKLRHTYASLLIDGGANAVVVQKNLGHEDVSMTMKNYVHTYDAARRREVDNLDCRIKIS